MKTILVIVIAYLFGSIPWALIIGKVFFHKDIRNEGSGNLGASNAGRVLGKPFAIIVTILDAFKAALSMLVAHYIAPGTEIYAGLACCLGHCFPIFAGFKGGKAVATSYGFFFGIVLFLTGEWFWQFILPILSFFLILYITRMVSVSSMASIGVETIASFILALIGKIDWSIPIAVLCLWIFVIYRHKENIARVKNGTESKITWMGPIKSENKN